ncbi:unnamed protein product [Arctia plantaginis]|uniref:Uncharacterized protein n=1 Tax=Arctia plantaginis TaxID=874455 RepID=A0A8S1B9Z2_ARCPL|nr:unnamed protein product [Arctia plantaginis]
MSVRRSTAHRNGRRCNVLLEATPMQRLYDEVQLTGMGTPRKVIPLDKIEETLESLFALSDGEESEDGHESDDRESEVIFLPPSSSDLEDILASPSSSNNGNAANFEPEVP